MAWGRLAWLWTTSSLLKHALKLKDVVNMPEFYEVRVKGHLGKIWGNLFEEWEVTDEANGVTRLWGPVQDQAALYGLLFKILNLGLPLISINPRPPLNQTKENERTTEEN